MMKDYFRKRPDLGLSIALHAFLFFALLFFVLLRSCSNKTPVHVFELTELSEAPSTQSQQSAPQVQAQEQAVPLPAKRMQIDDFLKEHPRSPSRPQPQPMPEKTAQNPIKGFAALPKFRLEPTQNAQNQRLSDLERSALQDYGRSIYRRISAQWNQPKLDTEKDLSVEVAFTVLASGMISDVQLIKRSGSVSFDRSILSVFKQIDRFEPTPSQKKERFQMVFKLN